MARPNLCSYEGQFCWPHLIHPSDPPPHNYTWLSLRGTFNYYNPTDWWLRLMVYGHVIS